MTEALQWADERAFTGSRSSDHAAAVWTPSDREHPPTVTKVWILSQLVEKFKQARQQAWAPKTRQMHGRALDVLIRFVGDKPVTDVTRHDCRELQKCLVKLTPNWAARYPKKTMRKVAAMNLEPMNPNTINRLLTAVTSFFNWAETEDLITTPLA